jgi:8-oxo-dGTP pyrophosphatase MutT (NUDIX family)
MSFEKVESEVVWTGKIATVRVERFRHDDDEVVTREMIEHPGAAVVVPVDGERIWLVSQPREVVGERLLELPAGKLDVQGEDMLTMAKRELREEAGKSARTWKPLARFYTSPGFTNEEIHAFLATDLQDDTAEADESERIEVVAESIDRLDDVIRDCRDAKSLVALLWFRAFELQ